MQENNNFGFNFDNTYIDLPKSLYSEIDLNKVPNPKFIIFNDKLAKDLNLSSSSLQSKEGLEILAGNTKAKNGAYGVSFEEELNTLKELYGINF